MSDARYPGLPEALVPAVRTASVPPYLRALFARIGVPIGLEVELPADASPPVTALQLIKFAGQDAGLRFVGSRLASPGAPLRLILRHGDKSLVLETADLGAGPSAMVRRIAERLLDPVEAGRSLERFAREAPRQDALRRLTRAMLETQSVARLHQITLLGMTSGLALGFNRAALFVYDEEGRALVGTSAIGPVDAEEAHRVWEAIELEDPNLEDLIAAAAASEEEAPFEEFVRSLFVDLPDDPTDEVVQALAIDRPLLFTSDAAVNPAIAALEPPGEFLVSAIKLRGKPLGVVVADNRYNGAPIDPDALDFVSFLLDTAALVLENLRLLESVETLARHDALTGLFNRREFETRLSEEQSRSARLSSQCGLLLVDVDHFKQINDARGHRAGDEVLQGIGVLLRSTLRAHDIVARFGGDEFAVLITDTNAAQILAIARRVGSLSLASGVSLSIGGSVWPRDNQEPSVLFAEADAALYEAKRAGRGRVCIDGQGGAYEFSPAGDDDDFDGAFGEPAASDSLS